MTIHYQDDLIALHVGRANIVAEELTPGSVQCIVTSPPYYGLRDYGHADQIGNERSVGDYVDQLVETFAALSKPLAGDGVLWVNIGDSYAGRANNGPAYDGNRGKGRPGALPGRKRTTGDAPYKSLIGAPWRFALAMIDAGWILRSEVVWSKPNPTPEAVLDRPTRSHEQLFMFTRRPSYYYDAAAIAEPAVEAGRTVGRTRPGSKADITTGVRNPLGRTPRTVSETRNKRDVWEIAPAHFDGAHFAVMPEALARPCILSSSKPGDLVLDPFSGSGTTGKVAVDAGRKYVGIDTSAEYLDLSLARRFAQPPLAIGHH